MKSYKVNEADAVFSESINITETTDTNHADNINAAPKEIFENTVALNREVKTIKKNMEEESGESIGYNNESSGLTDRPAERTGLLRKNRFSGLYADEQQRQYPKIGRKNQEPAENEVPGNTGERE